MPTFLGTNQLLLATLLVKIGVMASLATALSRFDVFRRILIQEDQSLASRLRFAAVFGGVLAIGVLARLLVNYRATDLTLEGALLTGLILGRVAGLVVGGLAGAAALVGGEWLGPAMGCLYGLTGGVIQVLCPRREEVWSFSPFPLHNISRFLGSLRRGVVEWKIVYLAVCVALELGRMSVASHTHRLWSFAPEGAIMHLAVVVATLICLGIPIKIWNQARIEAKLKEQESLLLRARYDALASQINPHFLFNTLNSISSLVRSDPDRARVMILKLSGILRRILKTETEAVPLGEELDLVDDYLSIEVLRFGPDKLRVVKHIDAATVSVPFPTMVLQPLVENAIKHGLSPKLEGGTVVITSASKNGLIEVEVADDGVGVAPGRDPLRTGIGLRNVNERIKVLYGAEYGLKIESTPGAGTRVAVALPCSGPQLG